MTEEPLVVMGQVVIDFSKSIVQALLRPQSHLQISELDAKHVVPHVELATPPRSLVYGTNDSGVRVEKGGCTVNVDVMTCRFRVKMGEIFFLQENIFVGILLPVRLIFT